MNAPLSSITAALIRTWTWIYTHHTPAFVRDGRRQEIESDLWEYRRDHQGEPDARIAAHILLRLVLGVADDLQWHIEHRAALDHPRRVVTAIALVAVLIVAGPLWMFAWLSADDLPPLPEPPNLMFFVAGPPPTPPPPPPAPPARTQRSMTLAASPLPPPPPPPPGPDNGRP
jgi:hypothetical protein